MDQSGNERRQITPGATVTPPAAWVDLSPYPIPATPNPHFVAAGLCVLLDDSQIDLTGPERAWFYRHADMVTATAGAERAAQFSVSFDPACERIDVHSIAVIRDGQRTEHAYTAFFEVLRRERNMERLLFDGRLTVHVTLPDVRVGDVVETSYTLHGMRKSMGGRHAAWMPFDSPMGITEQRLRLRTPAGRAMHERVVGDPPQPTQSESDGVIDRRWRTFERPGIRYEPLAPPWMLQGALIQFSEWRDWAEVAGAFTPLYEDTTALAPDMEAEIARIAETETAPAARAAAALRFVQGSVRYLAISMGEGGFTPRPLADICATRYGDCKDKSKLLVAMARRLGLDACPALVNTRDGPALDTWLPSGLAFDHCIVRLRIDGKSHWLDPTQSAQISPLEHIAECRYGWALPLTPDTSALEDMGDEPHAHTLACEETVELGNSPQAPVRYDWRVIMRGWRAESLRGRFMREGEVGLFRLYAEDIQRTFPHARPLSQEIVTDDVAANAITTVERYEIADAWNRLPDGRVAFPTLDLFMRTTLVKLDAGARKLPVDLGHVGKVTRRVEIKTAAPWRITPWRRSIEGSTLSYETELKAINDRHMEMTQTLDIRAWTLPAEEAQVYRDVIAELDKSDLELASALKNGKFAKRSGAQDWLTPWDAVRVLVIAGLAGYWFARYAGLL